MPVLIVQTAGRDHYRVPLEEDSVRVGRSQSNRICLSDDPAVSRHHAEIALDGKDGWCVSDLGSHNGTYVDERPVTAKTPLHPGNRIRIGRTTLVYADSSDTAERYVTAPIPGALAEGASLVVPLSEILSATGIGAPTAVDAREHGEMLRREVALVADRRDYLAFGPVDDVRLESALATARLHRRQLVVRCARQRTCRSRCRASPPPASRCWSGSPSRRRGSGWSPAGR